MLRCCGPVLVALSIGSGNAQDLAPPVQLTAEQDHQRVMDLLHIDHLRQGANGMHPKAPNAANYDEAKVGTYTLPDPLTMNDGSKVTTPEQWWQKRRPEIASAFDREIYGVMPATPSVKWEIVKTDAEKLYGVPMIVKTLKGHVDNSSYPAMSVDIDLTLVTPASAKKPVPVIMEFGFVFPKDWKWPKGFKPYPGPPWQLQVLQKGWGYAEYYPYSVQADNGAGLTAGIIGLVNKGQPRKLDDWGALRAWAWGASRALDYFESDPAVDAAHVGIEGHSRFGKAALIAMAYDPRFAVGFISSSGEGGASLMRRNYGELVENLAGGEYYWMAGNFLKYAGPLTAKDLPVDAHELFALAAPRPLFVSAGTVKEGDGWVDAKGMFEAEAAANPVYELIGKKGLGTDKFPKQGTALTKGDLAFRQHAFGHTPAPNWPDFLNFAGRYLEVKT
jgi:hypothetical protein